MLSILITAGPTREHLDDVRFLSNASSGRMGCALAEAAMAAGHQARLVLGPVRIAPPHGAAVISVTSALEMQAAAEDVFETSDIVIAAAAVTDWRPVARAAGKPPRAPGRTTVELEPNPDIVKGLAARKGRRVVFGFALESTSAGMAAAVERGRRKIAAKDLDAVAVNLHDAMGSDEVKLILCYSDGRQDELPRCDKRRAAELLVAAAVGEWEARNQPGGDDASGSETSTMRDEVS